MCDLHEQIAFSLPEFICGKQQKAAKGSFIYGAAPNNGEDAKPQCLHLDDQLFLDTPGNTGVIIPYRRRHVIVWLSR